MPSLNFGQRRMMPPKKNKSLISSRENPKNQKKDYNSMILGKSHRKKLGNRTTRNLELASQKQRVSCPKGYSEERSRRFVWMFRIGRPCKQSPSRKLPKMPSASANKRQVLRSPLTRQLALNFAW